MKLQFETGRLRIRVGRAELATLRDGGSLSAALDWPGRPWRLEARASEGLAVSAGGDAVHLVLPRADLDALAARAPSREGLRYALDLPSGPVDLRFEVDLHDGRARPR